MASSTTIAIASTSPNRVKVFKENPINFITANVAISDTGIAIIGIMTALQLCKNSSITTITMSVVSANVTSTSSIEAVTNDVVSIITRYWTPSGKYCDSSLSLSFTLPATSRALAPGSCCTPIRPADFPDTCDISEYELLPSSTLAISLR